MANISKGRLVCQAYYYLNLLDGLDAQRFQALLEHARGQAGPARPSFGSLGK